MKKGCSIHILSLFVAPISVDLLPVREEKNWLYFYVESKFITIFGFPKMVRVFGWYSGKEHYKLKGIWQNLIFKH